MMTTIDSLQLLYCAGVTAEGGGACGRGAGADGRGRCHGAGAGEGLPQAAVRERESDHVSRDLQPCPTIAASSWTLIDVTTLLSRPCWVMWLLSVAEAEEARAAMADENGLYLEEIEALKVHTPPTSQPVSMCVAYVLMVLTDDVVVLQAKVVEREQAAEEELRALQAQSSALLQKAKDEAAALNGEVGAHTQRDTDMVLGRVLSSRVGL